MPSVDSFQRLQQLISEYGHALTAFIGAHQLPAEWFAAPDHVAYKCQNAADYDHIMELCKPFAKQRYYIAMDGRRLGSIRLQTPLAVADFGTIEWLEVMQPRPAKEGVDMVGLEHMEFVFPDFDAAQQILNAKNIPYERQSNPAHEWISIMLNSGQQELKLNNRSHTDIVQQEFAAGLTKEL